MEEKNMRSLFPALAEASDWIYLDSAATAQKPKTVIDALSQFYAKEYATVHRAIYQKSLAATEKYESTRKTVQKFIGAKHSEEIIFTRGTTDSINLVAQSLGLSFQKGDEIIVCEAEHHSNLIPWQMLCQRTGALLRWAPIDEKGDLDREAFRLLLTDKTKLVAIAHVSNVTGTIYPIRELSQLAHAAGAKILVDGAQAASHLPIDVQDLDVDFYAFSGHKCYGPTGVGVLYGKLQWLEEMPPVQGGGDMANVVELAGSTYQPAPLKFEAGTPLIGPVIAFKPALDLLLDLGMEAIGAWEKKLYDAALLSLQEIPGFRLIGASKEKGALLTFSIENVHPLDLATFLDLKNISIRSGHLCAQTALGRFGLKNAARASFGLYNTLQEAQTFAETVRSVASKLSAS